MSAICSAESSRTCHFSVYAVRRSSYSRQTRIRSSRCGGGRVHATRQPSPVNHVNKPTRPRFRRLSRDIVGNSLPCFFNHHFHKIRLPTTQEAIPTRPATSPHRPLHDLRLHNKESPSLSSTLLQLLPKTRTIGTSETRIDASPCNGIAGEFGTLASKSPPMIGGIPACHTAFIHKDRKSVDTHDITEQSSCILSSPASSRLSANSKSDQ